MGEHTYDRHGDEVHASIHNGSLQIHLGPTQQRKIALLCIPYSVVSFRFDGVSASAAVTDRLFRPLKDLRISVTDRCNFRCVYCMPKEVFDKDYRFLPRAELLTFEEIERVVQAYQNPLDRW